MNNEALKKRIIDISYKYKLSHIGSCLGALPILSTIYKEKGDADSFILSAGHAGLALYVVLESQGGKNAEDIFHHHGVHPDYCRDCGIDCSSGSLGHGFPVAVGMALTNRKRDVWVLSSDGEMTEGSMWEALRIAAEQKLDQLKLYINCNGYGAYSKRNSELLIAQLRSFGWGVLVIEKPEDLEESTSLYFQDVPVARIVLTKDYGYPFLQGQDAHYKVLTKQEYESTKSI